MAFDGHPHRAAAWLKPAASHPGAPAGAEILGTALAGAYGYALSAANAIGQLVYRWSFEGATEEPVALRTTTPVGIGQLEGYVPGWASKIVAEVVFVTLNYEEGTAGLRVTTPSDTGAKIELTTDLTPDRLGEPWDYKIHRIRGHVDLSATTLDDDVVVNVEMQLVSPDTARAIALYPLIISVWWE